MKRILVTGATPTIHKENTAMETKEGLSQSNYDEKYSQGCASCERLYKTFLKSFRRGARREAIYKIVEDAFQAHQQSLMKPGSKGMREKK
jgi:hypothetical protein